jgi:ubiquitin C-terminal hydrolase
MNQSDDSYKLEDSVGLPNCGNQCYLSSALQMLYSINEVREYILNYKKKNNLLTDSVILELNQKIIKYDIIREYNIIESNKNEYKKYRFLYLKTSNINLKNQLKEILEDNILFNINQIFELINKYKFSSIDVKFLEEYYRGIFDCLNEDYILDNTGKKIYKKFKDISDSQEFLIKIINIFDNKDNNKNTVYKKFEFNINNVTQCLDCNNSVYYKYIGKTNSTITLGLEIAEFNSENLSLIRYNDLNQILKTKLQKEERIKKPNRNPDKVLKENQGYAATEECRDNVIEKIKNNSFTFRNSKYNSNIIKKEEIDIPPSNKYMIIYFKRVITDLRNDNYKNLPLNHKVKIYNTIEINNIGYKLLSCILNTYNGHYIYTTFNEDGSVCKTYDDNRVLETEISAGFTLENNSYVLLYYRIDSLVNTEPPELLKKTLIKSESTFHPNIPTYYSLSLSDNE